MGYVAREQHSLGAAGPQIEYARGITTLPGWAADWLGDLMTEAGVGKVQVSSTVRTAQQQAQIMYDAAMKNGIGYTRDLYKSTAGKAVADIIQFNSGAGFTPRQVVDMVAAKISENPGAISTHVISDDDDGSSFTFDVGPNASFGGTSSTAYQAFLAAALSRRAQGQIKTLIYPPQDDGIHFKLVQSDLAGSSMQALKNALLQSDSEGDVAPGGVPMWAWGAGALAAGALYLRRRK